MGIWDLLSSTAEQVKRHALDTISLNNVYNTACSYGSTGFTTLTHCMPDNEAKSKIATFASKFAENAAAYAKNEGVKHIPGGVSISEIVSKTLEDVKYENLEAEKLKALGARTPQMNKIIDPQGPQEVIDAFMRKDFFGNRMFDDLIVTELCKGEGQKTMVREKP